MRTSCSELRLLQPSEASSAANAGGAVHRHLRFDLPIVRLDVLERRVQRVELLLVPIHRAPLLVRLARARLEPFLELAEFVLRALALERGSLQRVVRLIELGLEAGERLLRRVELGARSSRARALGGLEEECGCV